MKCLQKAETKNTKEELVVVKTNYGFSLFYLSSLSLLYCFCPPAAIHNIVISLVLGAEVDVDVDTEFFEMISQMNFISGETFSVSIKTRCRLIEGRGPTKAEGWQQKYFFARISPASVANPSAVFRTEWNPEPGSLFVLLIPCYFRCLIR